jgi:hypothetical protein
MEKIVVRLRGGLGNQLFIYAYARSIQEYYKNAEIILDLREYRTYKLRNYDLANYFLNSRVKGYNSTNISYFNNYKYAVTRKFYHLLSYINKKYLSKMNKDYFMFFSKFGYLYNGNAYYPISSIPDYKNTFIYGYFQNKKYADSIYEALVTELKLKVEISSSARKFEKLIKSSSNSIAVSVRCGEDYLKLGWPMCSPNFYKQGIKYIQSKYSDCDIYVFADDIDTVKHTFDFDGRVTFIEDCKGYESLYLMSLCNNFVIANSSFSWWGSYLSQKKDKIIVAPSRWFTKVDTKESGLYLDNMILIDN